MGARVMIEAKVLVQLGAAGLLLSALGCGSGPGFEQDPDQHGQDEASREQRLGQRQQSIVGGETDREHIAVLAIATITEDTEALCTGTLIAPNLVLTARHCVVPIESDLVSCGESTFPSPYSPDALWVSPATRVSARDLFPVREIAVPEDDGALCGADIALLILDGEFTDSVTPIDPRLDAPALRGESFTAVGFGTALEDGDPGIRRFLDGVEVVCGPNQCGSPDVLTDTEFVGEQAVCEGDSGGPALDESGRVLGVASRTGNDCNFAIYSAVSPWRDFIMDVAERASAQGTYGTPAWLASALADDGEVADLGSEGDPSGGVSTPGEVPNDLDDAIAEAPADVDPNDLGVEGTSPSSAGGSGCALATPANGVAPASVWTLALGIAVALRLRRRILR